MSCKSSTRPDALPPLPWEPVAVPVLPAHAARAPVDQLQPTELPDYRPDACRGRAARLVRQQQEARKP